MSIEQAITPLVVEIETEGLTTLAVVRGVTKEEGEAFGPALTEEFDEDSPVGYGIAKCRKDDHFDRGIGMDLAVARAMKDYAECVEKKAEERVQTEKDFQVTTAVDDIANHLAHGIEAIRRLANQAAS
jgi:hypothetical protein